MEKTLDTRPTPTPIDASADSDDRVVAMWLHGRSENTQAAYSGDVDRFFAFVGAGLRQVTLQELQAFADSLDGADATRARKLSSVKSLLKFAHRLGYTAFDVGAPLRLPKVKNTLAERILTEEQVVRMIALEPDARKSVLLRVLYASGGRVSEICSLKWKDTQTRDNGAGQITLYGKGGKTRVVLLSSDTWAALQTIRNGAEADDPVFLSRKGGHLDRSQALRIVQAAAQRAGIEGNVSPHWFRHSHASHALDRNAPIHVVQATLGHASLATTSKYVHARPTESSGLYLTV